MANGADIAELGFKVDSEPLAKANDELEKLPPRAKKAEDATEKFNREVAKTDDLVNKAAKGATTLGNAVGRLAAAAGAYFSVSALVGYADAWSDMQSRVGAAIKDMEAAPLLMQRIVDIANASYSPLSQTVETYARNSAVLRELGLNAAEVADATESLNHMLVITATRGERAESVQNALSKAMAVGKLQAEGLETVLANGGRVAEALAEELGVNVSQLRAMASQGKITSDVIAKALLNSLEDVRVEAGEMTATIGDAFVIMNNNITQAIGEFDKLHGISATVAEGIIFLANNLDILAAGVAGVAAAITVLMLPAITSAIAAFSAFTAVLLANPLTWLAAAAGVATTAIIALNQANWAAEDAARTANDAYASNAAAMETMKAASGGYTEALRNQIAMQVEAARTAVTMAEAAWQSSITTRDAFRSMFGGLQFAPFELDSQIKLGNVNALDMALAKLETQLAEVDANLIPVTSNLNGMSGAASAANDNVKNLADTGMAQLEEAARKQREEWDFYRSTFSGFWSDFRNDLMNGTSLWDSFKNAASRALDSIANRLLDMASNGLFDLLFGGLGSILGGAAMPMGGFIPGLTGPRLFASGGYTGNGPVGQAAGIVHGQEFVMNAAATSAIGVGTLQAINDNHVLPSNDNGTGFIYQDNRQYDFSGTGMTREEIEEILARDREEMLATLPDAIQNYQNDPRKRIVSAA